MVITGIETERGKTNMISNIVVIRFLTVFKGNTSFYNKNELPKVKPEGGKFKIGRAHV